MTLHIDISKETESKLRDKAASAGQDVSTYVSAVLERIARSGPSIEEISGPTGEAFRKSGMTEDELTDELERAKHDMRAKRLAS